MQDQLTQMHAGLQTQVMQVLLWGQGCPLQRMMRLTKGTATP